MYALSAPNKLSGMYQYMFGLHSLQQVLLDDCIMEKKHSHVSATTFSSARNKSRGIALYMALNMCAKCTLIHTDHSRMNLSFQERVAGQLRRIIGNLTSQCNEPASTATIVQLPTFIPSVT